MYVCVCVHCYLPPGTRSFLAAKARSSNIFEMRAWPRFTLTFHSPQVKAFEMGAWHQHRRAPARRLATRVMDKSKESVAIHMENSSGAVVSIRSPRPKNPAE